MSKVALLKVKLQEGIDTSNLFGSRDAHLKMIEDAFGIRVSARGEEVLLEGAMEGVRGLLAQLSITAATFPLMVETRD